MEQKNKYVIICLLLVQIFTSCEKKQISLIQEKNDRMFQEKFEPVQTAKSIEQICLIERDSIVVNSKYYFQGKTKNIKELLVKNDSILANGNDCGDWLEEEHDVVYEKGFSIEENKDNYTFNSVSFSNNSINTVFYKKFLFDKNYKLNSFKKDFCKKIIDGDEEVGKNEINFKIPYSIDATDSFWIFTFKNSKLSNIKFFNPC